MRYDIILIIPAYNEADTIGKVLDRARPYVKEIILVDDASRDGTGEIAGQHHAHVVRNSKNLGYDGALNVGFAEAARRHPGKRAIFLTFDADGQHDERLIPRYAHAIGNGADMVVGVRHLAGRRISDLLFSLYCRLRLRIADPLCGMKAYRAAVYRRFGTFDTLESIGTELLFRVATAGYAIAQIRTPVRKRKDMPRLGTRITANLKIFRAMWRVMRKV